MFADDRRPEVLVVDDDPFIVRLLGVVLSAAGFAVRQAVGGADAVRLYARHRDSIAAVLLAVGRDGPLNLLRASRPDLPAAFMSDNITTSRRQGGRGMRVLVVDDSPDNRDSLALLVRAWGHEV